MGQGWGAVPRDEPASHTHSSSRTNTKPVTRSSFSCERTAENRGVQAAAKYSGMFHTTLNCYEMPEKSEKSGEGFAKG